ncbi:MAG: GNAT family N-acetyltransferase [Pseudomonadota bacterium]
MKYDVIPNQMVLDTPRLVLRPPRTSDAGLMSFYAGDRRVAEMTRDIPHPLPPGASEAFIARALKGDRVDDVWVMDGSANGLSELLGVVSLARMEGGQSAIGYWVGPAFWNTGIASEAVQAIVQENPLDNRTIFAEVFQDNPSSAKVLTHAGFEYIGDAEGFSVARGATVKTWTYLRRMDI